MILLIACLLVACAFEFVNGFHDTANAVATVIYTKAMRPWIAVIWSGMSNFLGVLFGGIITTWLAKGVLDLANAREMGVAMGIVKLLPSDLYVGQSVGMGIAMILAMLLGAIIWNLATWYVGIPASSSHTLIGSILGVGVAYSFINTDAGNTVNWTKAQEIGLSLLVSPIFGFVMAMLLFWLLQTVFRKLTELFTPPEGDKPPVWWLRGILIFTCTGVSFFHGSNDGQKGVGLIMLILISIVPGQFALNSEKPLADLPPIVQTLQQDVRTDSAMIVSWKEDAYDKMSKNLAKAATILNAGSVENIAPDDKAKLRNYLFKVSGVVSEMGKGSYKHDHAASYEKLSASNKLVKRYTEYAPTWVILIVSLSLGIGTMVGWKRIVVTIGERLGKTHMSYAQGASAELVAMSTIGIATATNLPVSTTHVLSSGVAGTMVAHNGIKNLQSGTVRSIVLAWVLTLPVTIIISGLLFMIFSLFT